MGVVNTETNIFKVFCLVFTNQLDKVTKVLTQTVFVNVSKILSNAFFMALQ